MQGVYICPVCKNPLEKIDRGYACKNGHSFDLSKEGYLNLLPANQKKSASPGDNKQMVAARHAFLQKGYYLDLATELSRMALPHSGRLLDVGCGTGYYGKIIKDAAKNSCDLLTVYGIDISKFAVQKAAKNGYDGAVVGSVFNLPFSPNAFDCAIAVFAPVSFDELYTVLKKGAKLYRVTPAQRHLIELKEAVYGNKVYLNPPENTQKCILSKSSEAIFEVTGVTRLTTKKHIDSNEDILALFEMTPYAYKTPKQKKDNLLTLFSLDLTFDFTITEYTKY